MLLLLLPMLLLLMLQCFETQAVDGRASFAGKGGLQRHDSLGNGHRAIAALLSRLRIICSSALRIMMIGAIIGCGGCGCGAQRVHKMTVKSCGGSKSASGEWLVNPRAPRASAVGSRFSGCAYRPTTGRYAPSPTTCVHCRYACVKRARPRCARKLFVNPPPHTVQLLWQPFALLETDMCVPPPKGALVLTWRPGTSHSKVRFFGTVIPPSPACASRSCAEHQLCNHEGICISRRAVRNWESLGCVRALLHATRYFHCILIKLRQILCAALNGAQLHSFPAHSVAVK